MAIIEKYHLTTCISHLAFIFSQEGIYHLSSPFSIKYTVTYYKKCVTGGK